MCNRSSSTRRNSISIAMRAVLLVAAATWPPASAVADDFQSYCQYLGEDPSGETVWSDGVSGIASDGTHWYLANRQSLWRVPASQNLRTVGASRPGVLHRGTFAELGLVFPVSWGFGDPCVFRFNGVNYLIVRTTVYDGPPLRSGLAVFNAETLTGVAMEFLEDTVGTACGVDSNGFIYLNRPDSEGNVARWRIDWPRLAATGQLSLTFRENITLYDENGSGLPFITGGIVGVEFTPDDRYVYILGDDIHVFDADTLRRGFRSTNATTGFFPFSWRNNGSGSPDETPEGLCIWNLEGTDSPHTGMLHVVVRDWDDFFPPDDVFLKHYTSEISVRAGAASPGDGTRDSPYPTVSAAADAAWFGAELRIEAGVYDEAVTISQRVRIKTVGGLSRIGG